MAAPTYSDIEFYLGTNGVPADDSSAYGGAISTNVAGEDLANAILSTIVNSSTDVTYYTAFHISNEASGDIENARVYNRAGMKSNTSSGSCQVVSTDPSETRKVRIVGKVSGVWDSDTITLTGTTPVFGIKTFDANSIIRAEVLTSGGAATKPTGRITVSCDSQTLGIIYGTSSDTDTVIISSRMISAEFDIALATSKNTSVGAANRLTAPTGVSSFSRGTWWAGSDESLPVPGNRLDGGESIGVAVRFTDYEGALPPTAGEWEILPILLGNPVA